MITALLYPKTIKEALTIFMKFNYHCDFIPCFIEIALPIMKAIGQNKKSRVDNHKAFAITSKRVSIEANTEIGKQPISSKEIAKARYAQPFSDIKDIRKAFEILKARLSVTLVLMYSDFE